MYALQNDYFFGANSNGAFSQISGWLADSQLDVSMSSCLSPRRDGCYVSGLSLDANDGPFLSFQRAAINILVTVDIVSSLLRWLSIPFSTFGI